MYPSKRVTKVNPAEEESISKKFSAVGPVAPKIVPPAAPVGPVKPSGPVGPDAPVTDLEKALLP